MAHGLKGCKEGRAGSRRIFAPHFKLQVLDSYRSDADCKGNQRATARKYGIHRRQIQKWLQAEGALRSSVGRGRPRPPDAAPPAPARAPSPDPAPMDLSLKRAPAPPPPWDLSTKPRPAPKLFKPYLDDVAPRRPEPCCSRPCDYEAYTLHELQPRGAATPAPTPAAYYYAFPAYEAPCCAFEDAGPLKQRHSYSLDFKLSAIECYYQDSVCKGNQRAVASKYNVHRRQVQKWLKQADELRERNETGKHTQAVS